jgi:RNA polymerase sigma-70 factor (ECF subfamily)
VEEPLLRRAARRAARGDERAAAELFDEYHPRLYRYALAKLSSPADAEDVAAETFARVLRDLHRFRWKGAGFEAWIFRIAANLVVDHHRRAGRETPSDDTLEPGDAAGPPTPESAILQGELTARMGDLLNRLGEDQREVLLLRFAGGLDTDEAGRVLGRSANAVRQLQFRALENLRRMMAGAEAP